MRHPQQQQLLLSQLRSLPGLELHVFGKITTEIITSWSWTLSGLISFSNFRYQLPPTGGFEAKELIE
jgi:hypothetical protein